jgi:hypothetical protein
MNQKRTFTTAIFLLLLMPLQAYAAPVLFGSNEKIIKVMDFPDIEQLETPDGKYVDAGVKYQQFSLFYLPLWNSDPEWVGYKDEKTYYEFSKEDLDEYAGLFNLSLPDKPELPVWDAYGGKAVIGLLLLLYLMYLLYSRKSED